MKLHGPGLLPVRVPLLTSRVTGSNLAGTPGCRKNHPAAGPAIPIDAWFQWGGRNPGSSQSISPAFLLPTESHWEVWEWRIRGKQAKSKPQHLPLSSQSCIGLWGRLCLSTLMKHTQSTQKRRKDRQWEVWLALVPRAELSWLSLGTGSWQSMRWLHLLWGADQTPSLWAQALWAHWDIPNLENSKAPPLESAVYTGSWNITSSIRLPDAL